MCSHPDTSLGCTGKTSVQWMAAAQFLPRWTLSHTHWTWTRYGSKEASMAYFTKKPHSDCDIVHHRYLLWHYHTLYNHTQIFPSDCTRFGRYTGTSCRRIHFTWMILDIHPHTHTHTQILSSLLSQNKPQSETWTFSGLGFAVPTTRCVSSSMSVSAGSVSQQPGRCF